MVRKLRELDEVFQRSWEISYACDSKAEVAEVVRCEIDGWVSQLLLARLRQRSVSLSMLGILTVAEHMRLPLSGVFTPVNLRHVVRDDLAWRFTVLLAARDRLRLWAEKLARVQI